MEPRSQDLWVQKSRVFYKLWGRYMLWFILISVKPVVAPTHLSLFVATVIIVTLYFIFFFVSSLSPMPPFSHLSHLFLRELKRHFATVLEKKIIFSLFLIVAFSSFVTNPFKHLWMIIVVVERSQNELLLLFISLIYIGVIK